MNSDKKQNSSVITVKDKHFIAQWSLADEPKIERYTLALKQMYGKPEFSALYSKLADAMIDLIDKKHNDHHSACAELGHDWLKVEPINQPYFEEDMCTFQGLNKLLKIYAGTATGIFKWMGKSSATATALPYTNALATEVGTRQDITTTGFHEIKGCSIRAFSAYPSTTATITILQMGLFDASTSGLMLAIHDWAGQGFVHAVNAESFSLGMVIDLVPFGDI